MIDLWLASQLGRTIRRPGKTLPVTGQGKPCPFASSDHQIMARSSYQYDSYWYMRWRAARWRVARFKYYVVSSVVHRIGMNDDSSYWIFFIKNAPV